MTSGGVFLVFGGDRVVHRSSMRSPSSNLLARFLFSRPSSLSDLSAYCMLSFALKLCVGSQRCEGTGDEQLPTG